MAKKPEQLEPGANTRPTTSPTQGRYGDFDLGDALGVSGDFKLPERRRVSTEVIVNQTGDVTVNLEGQQISPYTDQKPSSAPQLPETTES